MMDLLKKPDNFKGRPASAFFNQLAHILIVGLLINVIIFYLAPSILFNLAYSILFPIVWETTQYLRYNSDLLDSLQDAAFMYLGTVLFFALLIPDAIFVGLLFTSIFFLMSIVEQYK
jgi:hypothetical protein